MHSQSSATWQDRKHRKFLLEGKRATWVFKLHLGGTRAKNKKQKKSVVILSATALANERLIMRLYLRQRVCDIGHQPVCWRTRTTALQIEGRA